MKTDDELNGYATCSMQEHLEEFRKWVEVTSVMNDRIHEMTRHVENLRYLPMLLDEVRSLRGDLVDSATGKNHLPLAATIPVIAAMAFCIAILGGLLFAMHTTGKVTIRPNSIEMHGTDSSENKHGA